jgi:hypothetical protein
VPALRRSPLVVALAVLLAAGACGATGEIPSAAGPEASMTTTTLTLTSPAFAEGEPIARRHACDGPGLSPPLAWSGAPDGTTAFALVVDDPDARGFVHWVVADIPGDAAGLPEGVPAAGPPAQGRNDFGRIGWGGPCPPSGTHRYVFTLYALGRRPTLPPRATAADLRRAIAGTVLAETRLTGTYRR